jgi:hypothetical protein
VIVLRSRVGPGDVLFLLAGASSRPSLARVELSVSSPGSGRLLLSFCRRVARTAHPVRALVGAAVSHVVRCASCASCGVEVAVLRQKFVVCSRPGRAPFSPLRIPKRARASLFSKLQRANGGCLGA